MMTAKQLRLKESKMNNNFWSNVPTWFKTKEEWVVSNLRSRLGATWNSGNYKTDEDQLAKMQAFFREINSLEKEVVTKSELVQCYNAVQVSIGDTSKGKPVQVSKYTNLAYFDVTVQLTGESVDMPFSFEYNIERDRIVTDHGNFASLEEAKKAFVINLRKRYRWAKLAKQY